MSFSKKLTLSNGGKIAQLGIGTWRSEPGEVEKAIEEAIKVGYRHIDCAFVYGNQREVGNAVRNSGVKREDLFLTSKIWNTSHQPHLVEVEFEQTLEQLGTPYLDLLLIHYPVAFVPVPGGGIAQMDPTEGDSLWLDTETSIVETWSAMVKLLNTGKVRAIGVSNFTIEHIQGIVDATGVKPVMNQIEAHPLLLQDDMVEYCRKEGIAIAAYSPLGKNLFGQTNLTEHPTIQEIAEKLNASPAQILIAWGVQRGYSVISKSVKPERILENFTQKELPEEDFETLTKLGRDSPKRFHIPCTYTPKWRINVFNEPIEREFKLTPKIC